ncbi:T9SS type A sorting domain-containing protein [Psychroflexus aestuariivivens]|uniref:T9SS type A sorting domain-containing protein n=1 Tax=Psychroflexus aestuariivivens TaxID=1795040 RepID=UPI001F005FC8|nr:T9SS type A sorting domain-containing protein [Psychroflexus aestuariivivens]
MKYLFLSILFFVFNFTIAQDLPSDCNCDYVLDSPNDNWPNGALNNKTICLAGNFTYNASWKNVGNNSTLCIGEGVTFNSQGLNWPNSGNGIKINNYGTFNHGNNVTIKIKNNSVINNYGTLTAVVKFQNGILHSYDGATTNLIGGDTNFDSGLINVYDGSVLTVDNSSWEKQMGSNFTLNNEGTTTFEGNLANSFGSINSSGEINFNQIFRNDAYSNISGVLNISGDLESNSSNATLTIENNFTVGGNLNVWNGIITANGGFEISGSTQINSTGTIQFGEEIIFNNLTNHAGLIESNSGCNTITLNGNVNGWGGQITANGESGISIPNFSQIPSNWVLNGTIGTDECASEPTVWIGVVSSDAENVNNWSNGFPTKDIDVTINITPNDPVFSEDVEMKDLIIVSGASVSQTNESLIEVYGNFENNGFYNPGNSTLAFKGSQNQNFSTLNKTILYNLSIDNGNNLNLVSGNIDIFNSLNLVSGNLVTNYDYSDPINNLVTFKSNSNTTAIISEIENGNTIVGDVMIERYIPLNNRAFRYMTTSVNTTTSINENWQEGVNNTVNDFSLNQNPKPGYGTHITGSVNGQNGFDATLTGNPSLFTWNAQNGSWTTINSTINNTLEAGKAYGILIRGDRSTNVWSNNTAMGSPTRLRSLGTVLTGDVNIDDDLNPNPDGFSLIGNPYQAEVDMKETLANSSNNLNKNFYYAYNPNLGNRGGYVTVDLDAEPVQYIPNNPDNNNITGDGKYRFLQPNQAGFVQTSRTIQPGEVPTLTFKESFKTSQTLTNQVFSVNSNSKVDLSIIKNSNNELMDGVRFKFGAMFDAEVGNDDALKFWNDDETIGIESNGSYLAIEKRPFPEDNQMFGFWIGNYRDSDYTMKVEVEDMPNYNIYLRDTYTNVDHELNDGVNNIPFTIDSSIPGSVNYDRFKVVFEQTTLSEGDFELNDNDFSLFPNPSTNGYFTIKGRILGSSETKVEIFNSIGQSVKSIESDFQEEIKVNTYELNSGVYFVKINSDGQQVTKKVIIK